MARITPPFYAQADQKFRGSSKENDFVVLVTAVHKKLG